jgi:hypothetical protein
MSDTVTPEIVEVAEVTVIEPETETETEPGTQLSIIVNPGSIIENIDAYRQNAIAIAEGYEGMSLADVDIKTMKSARAFCNSQAKFLNEQRLYYEKAYMAPFMEFKTKANKACSILTTAADKLGVQIKEAEEWGRNDRRQLFKSFYEDIVLGSDVPTLLDAVPFERILRDEWLNKSYKKNPETEIVEIFKRIREGWESLKKLNLEYAEQAEIVFFRTLDLAEAIMENDRYVQEAERIARMKAEREEARRAAMPEPEPVPEPAPTPAAVAPAPTPSVPTDTAAPKQATAEPVFGWTIHIECTYTQAQDVAKALSNLGLKGHIEKVKE